MRSGRFCFRLELAMKAKRKTRRKPHDEYDELIAMFRARIAELGVSLSEVDHVAGLPDGYTGKILRKTKTSALSVSGRSWALWV